MTSNLSNVFYHTVYLFPAAAPGQHMVHLRWLSLRHGEDIKAHLCRRLKLQLERERWQQHCSIAYIIVLSRIPDISQQAVYSSLGVSVRVLRGSGSGGGCQVAK